MRITLNLASRPFIELRPLYRRLRIWMLILVLLAMPMYWLLRGAQTRAAAATAQARTLSDNVQRLRNQQQSYEALMRLPENAAVLTQSEFLNQLFRSKAFSWTAVMTDLETVLPGGVQVLSIEPTVAATGDITIRMRVSGGRERAVDLVRNLEHSRHFADPRLAAEALATTAGTGTVQLANAPTDVNFDVLAVYRPLSPSSETSAAKKNEAKATTAGTGTSKKPKARIRPTAPLRSVPGPSARAPQGHALTAKPAGGVR
jgi:type IV pilus assembly protein PilN